MNIPETSSEVSGYIYVRSNELCHIHDCYKLGRTQNIPERGKLYNKRNKYIIIAMKNARECYLQN
jgi:hypothetical protein